MGQVIDDLQPRPHRVAVYAFDKDKINVVDRAAFTVAVNQVQRRAANAFDGRQVQFHWSGRDMHRLCAQFQRAVVGLLRVAHAKSHAADRRAVLGRKVGRNTVGLVIEDQVDIALTVQMNIFGTVGRHLGEAHDFKHRLKGIGNRGREFDKFKAHQAHRVFV